MPCFPKISSRPDKIWLSGLSYLSLKSPLIANTHNKKRFTSGSIRQKCGSTQAFFNSCYKHNHIILAILSRVRGFLYWLLSSPYFFCKKFLHSHPERSGFAVPQNSCPRNIPQIFSFPVGCSGIRVSGHNSRHCFGKTVNPCSKWDQNEPPLALPCQP